MHALGFYHEHSRKDRDNHIVVHLNNVAPENHKYFIKHGLGQNTIPNIPYDYKSLMHFGPTEFSMNSKLTIKAKGRRERIEKRYRLSNLDIHKINTYYQCEDKFIGCMDYGMDCGTIDLKGTCGIEFIQNKHCRKSCGNCQPIGQRIHRKCKSHFDRCQKWDSTETPCPLQNIAKYVRDDFYHSCLV